MTLHDFNDLEPEAAKQALLLCCGSQKWARRVADMRPFATVHELARAAEDVGDELNEEDWLEAFAAHPRIGERSASAWAEAEQAAALNAEQSVQQELAAANQEYEDRFGFIFIVFATGKTPTDILALLKGRLANPRDVEIRNAANEQRQITRARLRKLLDL